MARAYNNEHPYPYTLTNTRIGDMDPRRWGGGFCLIITTHSLPPLPPPLCYVLHFCSFRWPAASAWWPVGCLVRVLDCASSRLAKRGVSADYLAGQQQNKTKNPMKNLAVQGIVTPSPRRATASVRSSRGTVRNVLPAVFGCCRCPPPLTLLHTSATLGTRVLCSVV